MDVQLRAQLIIIGTLTLWIAIFGAVTCAGGQEVDEVTKPWALKRAYQLNGDSMAGCRLRADGVEWSCHSIDLSGEVRESQSGPKPELAPPPQGKKPAK